MNANELIIKWRTERDFHKERLKFCADGDTDWYIEVTEIEIISRFLRDLRKLQRAESSLSRQVALQ